jgi:hypothetical protein
LWLPLLNQQRFYFLGLALVAAAVDTMELKIILQSFLRLCQMQKKL